jgi:hypothetical protein
VHGQASGISLGEPKRLALPDSVLEEAPLLENIDLYRPPLSGIDMELYRQPMRRQKFAESIPAQRAKLQKGSQK